MKKKADEWTIEGLVKKNAVSFLFHSSSLITDFFN